MLKKNERRVYRVTHKDETSETIVRNLFSPFSYIQGSL